MNKIFILLCFVAVFSNSVEGRLRRLRRVQFNNFEWGGDESVGRRVQLHTSLSCRQYGMAMCKSGYRVFKVPNLKRPECGGIPTGCLLEPPPNACPRTPYVRCGEYMVKKYILNMKNPGCDRVPVCRRNMEFDQVYNNFDEQLGGMGDESVGRPSWSMGNGNTYRSGGHTMNSRGYLANPTMFDEMEDESVGSFDQPSHTRAHRPDGQSVSDYYNGWRL